MTKAAEITALDYPECVRLTPGMYVPSKTHLIYELTDNAVDEHIAGYCDRIDVVVDFNNDICSVEDNGRGMPIDPMKDPKFEGQCQAEVAYTCLHAGGKFKGKAGSYDAKTGGLHGVGAAVVNALSQNLAMFIKKSDHDTTYCLEFETGITTQKLFDSGEKILDKESGTKVVFKPDSTLWEEQFDIDDIKRRLKQTAYLNPKLTINLTIISGEDQSFDTYHFEDGISDFIKDIALENESNIIIEPIKLSSTINDVDVDISLAYTDSFTQELRSFCNCISTTDGGSHENGFKDALGKTVSKIIDDYNVNQKKKISIKTEDTREGMIAIVSVRVKSPTFDGQSKSRLKMLPVQRAVNETVSTELFNYLDRNPNIVKLLIDKIHLAAKAREAATRARENTRNAKQINSMDLSGKLADCLSKEPELCEIYIVEGDSAGGSAKQGRCRETQAILPIFGKIQNTQDCTFNKVINNDKIKLLIAALKCGIGKEYIYENLRYHKIILMSDADKRIVPLIK